MNVAAANSSGLYLYAIIPTRDHLIFDVGGVGTEDDQVYTIPYQDAAPFDSGTSLAAVVSPSPLPDYRGLKRTDAVAYLVAHQRVVEEIMQGFPLLPVKFGAVVADEMQVQRFLRQGEPLLRSALDRFGKLVQMEVVVLWNVQEVFREISQEEAVIQARSQLAASSPEANLAGRVALGQLVQASLERRRSTLRSEILPALREVAIDMATNPLMDDNMVVNVALLLNQENCEALDQKLEALDAALGTKNGNSSLSLTFRRVGPLPPYSFSTVDVQTLPFEAVDSARRCLGLGRKATSGEIKLAYHHLASQFHPDHNPDLADAEAKMTELTQAYRLLDALAAHQTTNPAQSCAFDPDSVSQTLLISLQRQELVA